MTSSVSLGSVPVLATALNLLNTLLVLAAIGEVPCLVHHGPGSFWVSFPIANYQSVWAPSILEMMCLVHPAGLPASISGFSCWTLGFHSCLSLLGFRLPLLASAVGLPTSTSDVRCWVPSFLFWAPNFLLWLLASDLCLLRLTKIKSAYFTLSSGLYTLCPACRAWCITNSQSEAGIFHHSAT